MFRRLARPMLAAVFVAGGVDTLRNPKPRAERAEPLVRRVVDATAGALPPSVPTDPMTLVKVDAAVKVGAGLALAVGRFPRLAALVLAASTVPTTVAGHPFWERTDPAERAAERVHFLKNLGLIGGLLFAASDRPRRHRDDDED